MSADVAFTLDPELPDRLELRGVLSESAKHDKEFEDHRVHYLTVDELPAELSEGLSEDERDQFDVVYYLRKGGEQGRRYQVRASEHSTSINRSLTFELEYFDPETEDTEAAVSRLLDSVERVVEHLDGDRYDRFELTRELYGHAVEPLYERDTTPELDDGPPRADEQGRLIPENIDT